MQKSLAVSIFNKQYAITTDEQKSDIERAAMRVDQLLRLKAQKGAIDKEKAAIIVALELAVELCKQEQLSQDVEHKIQQLIDLCT